MQLTHWTPHELRFTSTGLSDSTFVAPHEWCAKMVRDYIVEKVCEKLCFDEFLYFKKLQKP